MKIRFSDEINEINEFFTPTPISLILIQCGYLSKKEFTAKVMNSIFRTNQPTFNEFTFYTPLLGSTNKSTQIYLQTVKTLPFSIHKSTS